MMAIYYRNRQDTVVHQDGCQHLRRPNSTARLWEWAAGKTPAELIEQFWAAMADGPDYLPAPDMRLCFRCFQQQEQLDWQQSLARVEQERAAIPDPRQLEPREVPR